MPKGVPSYCRQPQLSCKHCQFWALFLFVFYIDSRRLRYHTEILPLLVYMYACSNPRTVEWMFMKHYTGECYQTLLRKFNSYLDRTVGRLLYLTTFLRLYVRLLSTSLSIYGTKCVCTKVADKNKTLLLFSTRVLLASWFSKQVNARVAMFMSPSQYFEQSTKVL